MLAAIDPPDAAAWCPNRRRNEDMARAHLHIDIERGTSAAELVQVMMPLVKRIAAKMSRGLPSHVRSDDLVSAGMVGLMEATRKFEPTRAESFVGYATLRI